MTTFWIVMADGSDCCVEGHATGCDGLDPNVLAHHLAQINRYTGATVRPYSVAEHSLLCADIAEAMDLPRVVQLACLTHDYHEAITGDMSSPVKMAVGSAWGLYENAVARRVRRHLGLHGVFADWWQAVKHVDLTALATERRDLLRYSPINRPWPVIDTRGSAVPAFGGASLNTARREQMHWSEWRDALRERFSQLAQLSKEEHAQRIERHLTEPAP